MKIIARIGWGAAIALLLCHAQVSQTRPTQLRILAVGPAGQPLRLSRADLYLDVWGAGKRISLPRGEGGATLLVDPTSVCTAWPEGCQGVFNETSRLILQADGYAPVTAKVRILKGAPLPDSFSVDIELPGPTSPISFLEGDSKEYRVPFRRLIERSIRVVDDAGAGVSGVELGAQLLFSESNHCGAIEGEFLFRGRTDRTGKVQIPDADGEVAVELGGVPHFIFQNGHLFPTRLLLLPAALPQTVSIHRFERRSLQLEFIRNGRPAAGLRLEGHLANPRCGASYGPLAETNARGRVQIDDFYPEEFESVVLYDETGAAIWESHPPFNPVGRAATITLPTR